MGSRQTDTAAAPRACSAVAVCVCVCIHAAGDGKYLRHFGFPRRRYIRSPTTNERAKEAKGGREEEVFQYFVRFECKYVMRRWLFTLLQPLEY